MKIIPKTNRTIWIFVWPDYVIFESALNRKKRKTKSNILDKLVTKAFSLFFFLESSVTFCVEIFECLNIFEWCHFNFFPKLLLLCESEISYPEISSPNYTLLNTFSEPWLWVWYFDFCMEFRDIIFITEE